MRSIKTNFGDDRGLSLRQWLFQLPGSNSRNLGGLFLSAMILAGLGMPSVLLAQENKLTVDEVTFGTVKKGEQVGKLTFLSAQKLRSDDQRFGGFSGLRFYNKGLALVAVSDRGHAAHFEVRRAKNGAITSLKLRSIHALQDKKHGSIVQSPYLRDAEALAQGPNGSYLISFEGDNRILKYTDSTLKGPGIQFFRPGKKLRMGQNKGMETLLQLQNNTYLTVSEFFDTKIDGHHGLRFNQKKSMPFVYQTKNNFRPVDGMALASGDVLLLERSFTPPFFIASRMVRIRRANIKKARVSGDEIAGWGSAQIGDNFEGLAIVEWRGKTLVQVISDDNFSIFQDTYMLTFQLN